MIKTYRTIFCFDLYAFFVVLTFLNDMSVRFAIYVDLYYHCWFNLGYRKLCFCSQMGIIMKERKSSLKVLII